MFAVRSFARRTGFTLVELLVVISIIGLLASLITPAIMDARRAAGEARISFEIKELEGALDTFKNAHGLRYPCDFTHPDPDTRLKLMLASAPGNKELQFAGAAALQTAYTGAGVANTSKLDPAEALVFWLSGTKQSKTRPFTGGGNNHLYFEFKPERLVQLDDDNGDGVIDDQDFPAYLQPDGAELPYVYFNFQTYPWASYQGATAGGLGVAYPYKAVQRTPLDPVFQASKSYQIIAAGYDGHYGADDRNKRYPDGLAMTPEDYDNITSFSGGRADNKLP